MNDSTAESGARHAVVSGLGPNGVVAALELLNRGFVVTVVEKRPMYTRPIHLHLRSTYLADVRRLSPKLYARLVTIATIIEENLRIRDVAEAPVPNHIQDRRSTPRPGKICPIWRRLSTPPERHVRLDNAERLFFDHLEGLAAVESSNLTIRRGSILRLESQEGDFFRVYLEDADGGQSECLGTPEIVVIAEGGKSSTVQKLGLESVRFSYPKYFMSAHVAIPFGPRTLRIDTDVRRLTKDPDSTSAEVSLWACGHGDADEGTWLVIEVPEALVNQQPEQAEEYFLTGAMQLMSEPIIGLSPSELSDRVRATIANGALLSRKRGSKLPGMEVVRKTTFAGTFKFEQQCLRHPAAGKNVVVLGDAAGMGHHALSSGLEMGAHDLGALGELCQALTTTKEATECIAHYADAVFRSRMRLLGLGMNEYYPDSAAGRLKILHRAAELFGEDKDC